MASCAPVKPFLKILDLPYILLDILKNELFCYQFVTRKMGKKWPEKRRANGPCLRFVNRICYLISGVLLLYCTAGEYFLYLFTVSNYRERQ